MRHCFLTVALGAGLFIMAGGAASAQQRDPTAEEIEAALTPVIPPAIERNRSFRSRGISSIEPDKAAKIESKPVGVQIKFERDSAELTEDGKKQLDKVAQGMGRAAKVVRSRGMSAQFNIVGHASRDGDQGHNLSLSERRAQSVKTYLTTYWEFKPGEFGDVVGRGATQPLAGIDPFDAANRRVEFQTTALPAAARN